MQKGNMASSGIRFTPSSTSSSSPTFSNPFSFSVAPSSGLFGSNPSHPPASFTTPAFTPEHSSMPTSSSPLMIFGAASSVANFSTSTLSTDSIATEKHASEAKSEVPSHEQDKVMHKSKSMVEEFQTKTGENSGESKAVDPIIKTILNSGLNISLAKLPEEVETKVAICKSDKFSYTRILRGITHNPHFTPLQSYSKRSRERLIVGWDEIFQETIDQIQGLTTETFRTNAHELWKTIAELENLGYNVARLRKRLDELTDVVKKRDSSEAEISDLKAKADDYRKEKKKIESDIAGLEARAYKAQVMVDELVDQADKMESNLPVVDALFVNLAKNPL